jgi:hypothetical protein
MLCDADTDTDTDTGPGVYATGQVEVGGDTDSTEGAEPSHMHGGPGDENYNRGCELPLAHAGPALVRPRLLGAELCAAGARNACARADEWWLMKEAKARNPEIKLYHLRDTGTATGIFWSD